MEEVRGYQDGWREGPGGKRHRSVGGSGDANGPVAPSGGVLPSLDRNEACRWWRQGAPADASDGQVAEEQAQQQERAGEWPRKSKPSDRRARRRGEGGTGTGGFRGGLGIEGKSGDAE